MVTLVSSATKWSPWPCERKSTASAPVAVITKFLHKLKTYNNQMILFNACDFAYAVAFEHNKLWRPWAANSLCVTS